MKCEIRGNQIVEIPEKPKVLIDFKRELDFYLDFYKAYGVKIPRDFSKVFRALWARYQEQILRAVGVEGFDFLLLGLPVKSVVELDQQMTGNGHPTKFRINPMEVRENPLVMIPRLVLMYREPDLRKHPILEATLGKPAQTFLNMEVPTTFSDYRVYHKVVSEQDETPPENYGATWCPGSLFGSCVLSSYWSFDSAQLYVSSASPDRLDPDVGCRLSCCLC